MPQANDNKQSSQKNVEGGADALDLGEDYEDDEEDEEAIVEAAIGNAQKNKKSNSNEDTGDLPAHVVQAQQ